MADENRALTNLADNTNIIAADIIATSLDFTAREVYLVNEVRAGKVLASVNLSEIDGRKDKYCYLVKRSLDNLIEDSIGHNLSSNINVGPLYDCIKELNQMAVEPAATKNK